MSTRNPIWTLTLICLPLFTPAPTSGQTFQDALQAVAVRVGEWETTTSDWDGTGWQSGEATHATVRSILDGAGQHESFTLSGPRIQMEAESLLGWDQFKARYRYMILDAAYGVPDVYEGTLQDGLLIMTNERSESWFVTDDGTEMKFRLTYDLRSPDRQSLLVEFAIVGGPEEWIPMSRVDYRRIG